MTYPDPAKFIDEVLDLSDADRRILEALSRFAKKASTLARHAGIRPHSMPRILKRLERRHLVVPVGRGHKQTHWKSNMARILQAFRNECLRRKRLTKSR